MGPGWNRITASPPSQLLPVLNVLPVVTNGFFPSLATPPVRPYSAAPRTAMGRAGPRRNAGGIIDWYAYQPAMIVTAIPHAPIPNIKNVAYDAECRSLLLDLRIKVDAIV